jgi:carbamoyltransferase
MIILGISYYEHDSSAAIVCDGTLIAAGEEERFTRQKHDGRIPLNSIAYCLYAAGVRIEEVDVIAFPDLPFRFGRDTYVGQMTWDLVRKQLREGPGTWRHLLNRSLSGMLWATRLPINVGMNQMARECFAAIETAFGPLPAIEFFEHHQAHAASTYFTSGADGAAVITCDGVGGPYSTMTWRAHGNRLVRMQAELYPNSLGSFYKNVTQHLGLGDWGEGKTMGLAPYGNREVFRQSFQKALTLETERWYRYDRERLFSSLGFPPRNSESLLSGPFADAAAGAQQALEVALARIARSAMQGDQPLCLSGGVALNCSANGMLRRSGLANDIWVFPAAGDGGLSVGAALLSAAKRNEFNKTRLLNAYWGPEYSDGELEEALRAEPRLCFHRAVDVAGETADLLAAGSVVGWFQGRMELGPRALGNRSILADPRTVKQRDYVNRLKGRERWRPLAPSVLLHRAEDYFELGGESPFMLFAAQVRKERRDEIPAVVHVDGSARPQTVSRAQNPRFHALLSAFESRTGVPVLLNTSFNDAREPMIGSPQDAVHSFITCGLDVLVLGDYIALRQDLPEGVRPGAFRPTVS